MRRASVLFGLVALLALPGPATASYIVDRNAKNPTLKVNKAGLALVTYTTLSGSVRRVLVWGAVNGVAHPAVPPVAEAAFKVDPTGGDRSQKVKGYWKTFKNTCKAYTGPQLPYLVTGCTASDGSYWALQSWQRNLPNFGFDPFTPLQSAFELHLSHWTGPLPVLNVWVAWMFGGTLQGLFGQFLYQEQPVYGAPKAYAFARNVAIDSLDSDFGSGWKRVTSIAANAGDGGFCHAFVAQPPPPGYPPTNRTGNGLGSQFRVDAQGPGVTPIVEWTGPSLSGSFSPDANAPARQAFDSILANNKHCAAERPS